MWCDSVQDDFVTSPHAWQTIFPISSACEMPGIHITKNSGNNILLAHCDSVICACTLYRFNLRKVLAFGMCSSAVMVSYCICNPMKASLMRKKTIFAM